MFSLFRHHLISSRLALSSAGMSGAPKKGNPKRMAKHFITQVPGTPVPLSPISQAVVVGNTCHISGQLATYDDGYRPGSAHEEAERAFELLFRIAEHAGFERSDIVYVDIAFIDMTRDVAAINALYGALFTNPPARTIYQAAALPYGAKIKVQAVAMRD